jgi:hypothetical protein
VAVVNIEQLAGWRFEVFDQELDDTVGKAGAVEQRGKCEQGRMHARSIRWHGSVSWIGVGDSRDPAHPCTWVQACRERVAPGRVLYFVVGHGRQSNRTIPRNEFVRWLEIFDQAGSGLDRRSRVPVCARCGSDDDASCVGCDA